MPTTPWRRWAPHAPLAAIVALYLATAAAYAWRVPILEGADEHGHALVVQHVSIHGSPPRIGTLWEAVQPPLYYAVAAAVHGAAGGGRIVPSTLRLNDGFRFDDPSSADAFDPRSYAPADARPARRLRALSMLFGALTLGCVYATALAVSRGRRLVAWSAAALPALTPMYAHHHAVITNDSLATLWCAVVVWLLARHVMAGAAAPGAGGGVGGSGGTARQAVGMGIAAGLGIWTKLTMAPVAAAAAVLLVWGPGPAAARRRAAVRFALTAGAVASPWLILNTWHYGDPLARAAMQQAHAALAVQRTPFALIGDGGFWRMVFESYWGRLGSMTVPLRAEDYALFRLVAAVGALGLPVAMGRRVIDRRAAGALGLVVGLTWVAFVAHNLGLSAPQGRLLFPALPALSVLWAAGWTAGLDGAVDAARHAARRAGVAVGPRRRWAGAIGAAASAGLVAALGLVNLQTLAGPVQRAFHDAPAARAAQLAAPAPRRPAAASAPAAPDDGARPVASRAIRAAARPDRPPPAPPSTLARADRPAAAGTLRTAPGAAEDASVAVAAPAAAESRDRRPRRPAAKPRPPFEPDADDAAADDRAALERRRHVPNGGELPPIDAAPWAAPTPQAGGAQQPMPVPPVSPPSA